jgi:LysM repeat protein
VELEGAIQMKKVLHALSLASILLLMVSSGCQMRASKVSSAKPTPTLLALFDTRQQAAVAALSTAAASTDPAQKAIAKAVSSSSSSDENDDDGEPKPTPDLHRPQTYSLNKGEWPFCIARRFNLNPIDLLNASGLSLDSKPDVGFVLKIPQSGEWPESRFGHRYIRQHPVMHQVAAGETMYTIACQYGDVDPGEILEANELPDDFVPYAGKMLRIP